MAVFTLQRYNFIFKLRCVLHKKVCFLCNTEYLLHKIGGFLHYSETWVVEGCKLAYIIVANCATAYYSVF